jgi:hypothetical protein
MSYPDSAVDFKTMMLKASKDSTWQQSFVRPGRTVVDITPFTYTATLLGLGAAAIGQTSIVTEGNNDFALQSLTGITVNQTTAQFLELSAATVQFTDVSDNKTFNTVPANFSVTMGQNGLAFYMPEPMVFAPNSTIRIDIVNSNPGALFDFYINLHGTRIYYAN